MKFSVRSVVSNDKLWVSNIIRAEWGSDIVIARGIVYEPVQLDGFVAEQNGSRIGLLTYATSDSCAEIVTLNALNINMGIGTALVEELAKIAKDLSCTKLRTTTTNDNLRALRFYQRRGFRIIAVHPGAVDQARKITPQIPEVGYYGIPIHDEIELERSI